MGDVIYWAVGPDDADLLLGSLRALDRAEVEAASGDVERTVLLSLRITPGAMGAFTRAGEAICYWGAAPMNLLSEVAVPWLLGTDLLSRPLFARTALRRARLEVRGYCEQYRLLVNYVDARNTPSIRWLRRVGFTIEPAAPHGVAGLPFHRFYMGFDDV